MSFHLGRLGVLDRIDCSQAPFDRSAECTGNNTGDISDSFRAQRTRRFGLARVAAGFQEPGPLAIEVQRCDLCDRLREQFRRDVHRLLPVTFARFRRKSFTCVLTYKLI